MPVTIRECPHCYTRVGFLDDGVCPACGRRLTDDCADPTRTSVTVSQRSSLAPVCIHCGVATHQRAAVSQRTRSRTRSVLTGIGTILGYCLAPILRGGAIGIIYGGEDRKRYPHRAVRVSIPLCDRCQRSYGVPKPHRVDFENETMSFLVNREVALALSCKAEPDGAGNRGQPAASETNRTSAAAGPGG